MTFSQKKDALAYLNAHGYKVSAGKFSQDSHALVDAEGLIHEEDLLEYTKTLKRYNSIESDDFAAMKMEGDARKAIAAAEREEIRLEMERRELDKKWILRDEAEQDVCIWSALTRDYIAARLEKVSPMIIAAVGGDMDRAPELREVIDEAIADACNEVANLDEVEVEFVN